MKQLIATITIFCAVNSYAQTGTVNYKTTIKLGDMQLEGLPPEMAAMLPKEHSEEKVMYFTSAATLYENNATAKKEEPQNLQSDNIQIKIDRVAPDEKYYTDLQNQKEVKQKDLMGRAFLIHNDVKARKWKMTGNQKKILDHPAMEAVAMTDKDTITAWYTTDIPVAGGPQGIGGLPGLVLEASVNNNMTIKATAITIDDASAAKIKEPTKGKKITEEEYQKLVKEKQEEMKVEGGGRQMIIRTAH